MPESGPAFQLVTIFIPAPHIYDLKKLIIIGSSRDDGHATQVAAQLNALLKADVIDLYNYKIGQYDYMHRNLDDDYLGLMKNIISNYGMLIFVTPVYWYAMSGIMKVFFDRLTDLLDVEKDLGRQLKNKYMAVLTTSAGDHLDDQFWLPFMETARYLGMNYAGGVHTVDNEEDTENVTAFGRLLNSING